MTTGAAVYDPSAYIPGTQVSGGVAAPGAFVPPVAGLGVVPPTVQGTAPAGAALAGGYEPGFAGGQGFTLASQDGTVNPEPYTGASDSPGLTASAARQQVLNKIASGEANSYSEIYGGHTFSDFSDHPRIPVPISSGPNQGKFSTAAGRYQFLSSTWDDEAKRLGLDSFSPDNQDSAAWDLATRTYKSQTGRSLLADSQAGNVQWGALGSQWESLAGAKAGPGLAKVTSGGRQWASNNSDGSASAGAGTGASGTSGAALPGGQPIDPAASRQAQVLQMKALVDSMFASKPIAPTYNPAKYVPNFNSGLGVG